MQPNQEPAPNSLAAFTCAPDCPVIALRVEMAFLRAKKLPKRLMMPTRRRLRGGIAGALLVVDVDSPRERERMRDWHAGALSIRMPLMPNRTLHQVLAAATQDPPEIESRTLRRIVRMARGRIGWIRECARRLQMREYWRDDRLHLAVLCMDTEMAVRESRSGPRVLYRRGEALWTLERKCCW